jgi:hypothetical protein
MLMGDEPEEKDGARDDAVPRSDARLDHALAQYDRMVETVRSYGVDPANLGGRLELFARADSTRPGWRDPAGLFEEYEPGIFLEPATDRDDGTAVLTEAEFWHVATLVLYLRPWRWTRIGFEAGREYGHVNARADVRDVAILDISTWQVGESPDDVSRRAWTVEWPSRWWTNRPDGGPFSEDYIRRRFWTAETIRPVPNVPELHRDIHIAGGGEGGGLPAAHGARRVSVRQDGPIHQLMGSPARARRTGRSRAALND